MVLSDNWYIYLMTDFTYLVRHDQLCSSF